MWFKNTAISLMASATMLTTNAEANNITDIVEQNTISYASKASKICDKNEHLDTREEKSKYIELTRELREIINKIDDNNKTNSDNNISSKEQEIVFKNEKIAIFKVDWFYDIFVKWDFEAKWVKYNALHVNYWPKNDFILTKYTTIHDDSFHDFFPKLRITKSAIKDWINLCSEERYYDPVDWYNLKTNSSFWENIDYNNGDFTNLMNKVIEHLKTVK